MKKLTIALAAIIIVSFSACTNVETVEEAAAEEAQGNSKNDFLALFAGNDYKMGEGEDMVKVSFDLENYMNDCGDIGQFGWVGNYWAMVRFFQWMLIYKRKNLPRIISVINVKLNQKGHTK